MEDGTAIRNSTEDDMVPEFLRGSFPLRPHIDSVNLARESEQERGSNPTMPNVQTPKRSGDASNAPSSRRARRNSRHERAVGDAAFRDRHQPVMWDRVGP